MVHWHICSFIWLKLRIRKLDHTLKASREVPVTATVSPLFLTGHCMCAANKSRKPFQLDQPNSKTWSYFEQRERMRERETERESVNQVDWLQALKKDPAGFTDSSIFSFFVAIFLSLFRASRSNFSSARTFYFFLPVAKRLRTELFSFVWSAY